MRLSIQGKEGSRLWTVFVNAHFIRTQSKASYQNRYSLTNLHTRKQGTPMTNRRSIIGQLRTWISNPTEDVLGYWRSEGDGIGRVAMGWKMWERDVERVGGMLLVCVCCGVRGVGRISISKASLLLDLEWWIVSKHNQEFKISKDKCQFRFETVNHLQPNTSTIKP